MRKNLTSLILALFFTGIVNANNLNISNVTATTSGVSFNVSWDNSWNISAQNYDAVWVFIKTQDCSGNKTWDHRTLAASGHTVSGGVLQIVPASDYMGVYIKRTAVGAGNIASSAVTLSFQTPFTSITSINFDVVGIEMVYVPQEQFYAGDNSTNTPGSYVFATGGTPGAKLITSEGAMSAGSLNNNSVQYCNNPAIPAAFPKGFAAFYCMKYEITQNQYTHFLNMLSHTQQTNRALTTGAAIGTGALTSPSGTNRNAIEISTPSSGNPVVPAVYGVDLGNNNLFDEANDGGNIACNFLSWDDLRAYLDWSALRPMTELEFEKAARGPENPIPGGFPWGNTQILASSTVVNSGLGNETNTAIGTGLCNYSYSSGGPLRVGFAAATGTGRAQSGGSYYGIMELAGNVWEQTFTVGGSSANANYHINTPAIFSGALGNGMLSETGEADAPGWGNTGDATNSIIRGGGVSSLYVTNTIQASISDRTNHYVTPKLNAIRAFNIGGRGVRQN